MKKIGLLLFCLVGFISPAWGCSYWIPYGKYKVSAGQVYYQEDHQSTPFIVEGADANTFLSNTHYRYKKVNVTTATGEVVEGYSDGVTTFTKEIDILKNFDLITGWFGTNYASDATHVYYKGKRLEGLESTQAVFLRDKQDDGSTIEGLEQPKWANDGYVKDGEEVYYHGQLLEDANGAQLRRMPLYQKDRAGQYYVMDEQQIYFYGLKVAGDPKTAFELSDGYYLDAQHIYFRGEILEGADPNSFDQKAGLIASNGYVFFRNERLPLDGHSLEELDHVDRSGCLTDVSSRSLLKDRNGVYILRYTGEVLHTAYDLGKLNVLDPATFQILSDKKDSYSSWAMDKKRVYFLGSDPVKDLQVLSLNSAETRIDHFKLDARQGDTFYRDKNAIYHPSSKTKKPLNLSLTLGMDAQSLNAFATLWKAIIFRDNTSFYLGSFSAQQMLYTKLFGNDVKLVCFAKSHACFVRDNTLYYVFEDGTVKQNQVNSHELRCMNEDILLENYLEKYNQPGLCFDDKYFYGQDENEKISSWELERLLPYTIDAGGLEDKRLHSLQRLQIESKLLMDGNDL